MSNTYWFVEADGSSSPATREAAQRVGFAMEYHLNVLSSLEQADSLQFYLCVHPPPSLPRYGSNVVLVIVGDEYHVEYSYFNKVLAILRCYGRRQQYLDGLPFSALRFSSLIQFLYKSAGGWLQQLRARGHGADRPARAHARTLHIPLGCYSEYPASTAEPHGRKFDFGFLGSIGTSGEVSEVTSLRGILPPPKIQARREMVQALQHAIAGGRWNGLLQKTATFAESTSRTDAFNEAMAQTKISICPRGSNYETYRFYESFRAGCVVICEPLPGTWFYAGHPGIVLRDWSKLPQVLDALLSDPARLGATAAASRKFWRDVLCERVVAANIDQFLMDLQQPTREHIAARVQSPEGTTFAQPAKRSQPGT